MTEPFERSLLQGVLADLSRARPGGVFEAADAERLAPLLYDELLRRGDSHGLTGWELNRFRSAYYRSAAQNVELFDALSRVARALAESGVASIAVKGADLAKRLYPNIASRPMGDVDLYVSPKNAERAEAVLVRAGYRPWTPDMTPGLSRRVRHARLYVRGVGDLGSGVAIDLHWSLVGHGDDRRAPERDWIERHTRRSGEAWQRLSATAHLLYLAAHMKLQHYDEAIPLLWLVDFHRLAATGEIDWDELFADAARFGWTDAVGACALDVRERLGATLPEPLERIAASPDESLHRAGDRYTPERVVNELRTLPWAGRLALARAYVLPSSSYVRFRHPPAAFLPRWSWPLGYGTRWWRIAVTGASLVARRLKRGTRASPLLKKRETC